jgi:serine/threonine protein kinase
MSMAIRHPNVVQGFDAGQDGDAPYLVLEYVHGPSLPVLTASIQVPAEIAASICADIAEGLHAAHSMCTHDGEPLGLVHRNGSPRRSFGPVPENKPVQTMVACRLVTVRC